MPRRRQHPPPRHAAPAKAAKPAKSGVITSVPDTLERVIEARELFWNNVIREILTALSIMSAAGVGRSSDAEADTKAEPGSEPSAEESEEAESAGPLDGRLAVVTSLGERIPIAEVYPLFACGVPGTPGERALSMAVECTVFQIRSPAGEVYTLPLHEIRGFHALSQELMQEIAEAAQSASSGEEPFGFAAFTSLARTGAPQDRGGLNRSEGLGPAL